MGVQNDKNKRIVLEQFSQIEFSKSDGGYILHDLLRDIKFDINDTFFYICQQIDGKRTLADIAGKVEIRYGVTEDDAYLSVVSVTKILRKKGLVLVKGSLRYRFIKLFYNLTGYRY